MKIPTSRIDGHRDRLHSYGLHRNGREEEHTVASGRGLFMVSVRKSPVLKVVHSADRVEHHVVAVYRRRLTVTLAERNYFVIAVKGIGAHLLTNFRVPQRRR